ncbi:MAG: type IX secretion system membrane protein PorP/SprF, partial [Endomicrobiia bacterium]
MKKILVSTFLVLVINYKIFSAFYYIPEFGEVYGSGGCGAVNYGNVESIFYNPAGLAGITKYKEFVSSFNKHLYIEGVDINVYNLGYAMPLKFGLVRYKKVGNKYKKYVIPVEFTLGLGIYGMDVNSGLYKENIYLLSVASKIEFKNKSNILYGGSLKILSLGYGKDEYTIRDSVFSSGYQKTSFSIDLGIIYLMKNNLSLGLSVSNVLKADVGLKDKEELKPAINFGLG